MTKRKKILSKPRNKGIKAILSPEHAEYGKMNKGISKRKLPVHSNKTKVTGVTLYIGEQKKLDKDWEDKFLYKLSETGSMRLACEYSNVSRQYVYKLRAENNHDNDFEKRYKLAKEDYWDRLEEEVDRRGRVGVDEPLSYKGYPTGHFVKKYSDVLLERKLEAEMPEKYKKGAGVTINNQSVNQTQVVLGFKEDDEGIFSPD